MSNNNSSSHHKNFFWSRPIPGTLDHYCIYLALPTFLIALGIILAALMLARLLVLLDLLASDNSPLSTFLGLLADLVPHYLGLAIPAALCVAVFSSVRQMSINNEIDALLSSGISLLRYSRPYILSGIVVSISCIILYGYIQPYARYDFRAAYFYASHAGWVPNIQSHTIVKPSDNLVMVVDQATDHGTHLSGVFIRQKTFNEKKKPIEHIIIAKTGTFYTADNRSKIQLNLYNGQNLTLTSNGKNNITDFTQAEKQLKQEGKKVIFRNRGDDERELTIVELYQRLRHPTNFVDVSTGKIKILDIKAEFHFRLVRALSILCIPLLATGLAIIKKRKKRNWGAPLIAAVTLVTYDHIQQLGSELVASGHHSALIALWLPLFLFFILCCAILRFKSGSLGLSFNFLLKRPASLIGK
ncbi:LptF/LptG family permease [Commensalibacter papalotli (ex Servin-Garciduenas et al. 2014)]|uniref:YjgP/YjgQ family permease n=1 Tax=Commensalibacter papalotli (ex Servin-Garciduenas et al. 2014) TaxID=1208583 RepID=W7DS49_9PROT|nr:LptF/LptG family permease [Commensalibacter papalotli (ex Servin-Garciduenas et al. 2014)]EUK17720.1 YjgP/YjgQ family permease [Commensalibacter papalotli (ex Servin-Garciduenas et al. 2014)]